MKRCIFEKTPDGKRVTKIHKDYYGGVWRDPNYKHTMKLVATYMDDDYFVFVHEPMKG